MCAAERPGSSAEEQTDVLIVGASVAGMRTAQALRSAGYADRITVLGGERHLPYDKPPLSKDLLVPAGSADAVPLLPVEQLTALDLDLRLGTTAVSLDPAARVLVTDDGCRLRFQTLVIATGAVPRMLPGADSLAGVHTIRTLGDARALRQELSTASRAVVVGGGFIGAEFSAAARDHDVEVTILEAQVEPLAHLLGEEVGAALRALHEAHGVTVVTGAEVSGFTGIGRVSGVVVASGDVHPSDVVVVGIGARPDVGWLAGSGLPIGDGVECDSSLRVLGFPHIYAAGDIARWPHPLYGERLRIEHWTNAGDHATMIAADITGKPAPAPTLPYVWSDQYGKRIQIVGRPTAGAAVLVQGDAVQGGLTALYADGAGRLVAALVVDDPRLFMRCRKAISRGADARDFQQDGLATTRWPSATTQPAEKEHTGG